MELDEKIANQASQCRTTKRHKWGRLDKTQTETNGLWPMFYWQRQALAYGPIFSRGAEPSLPEEFFNSARENCYVNLQNYFARLTPPSNYY